MHLRTTLAMLSTSYYFNTLACKTSEFISGIPSSGRFVSSTYIFYSIRKSHGGFRALVGETPPKCDLAINDGEGSLCACLMFFDVERERQREKIPE